MWVWQTSLKNLSLFCSETQYFYRPAHPSWAWTAAFCTWSCTYEKSGKIESLKIKAGQAKPTHGIVQIIWAFPCIHIKETQRTENSPLFGGSIFHRDCLFLQGLCFVQTYSCFISTTDGAHLTAQSSYTSRKAGNSSSWVYYTSLTVSPKAIRERSSVITCIIQLSVNVRIGMRRWGMVFRTAGIFIPTPRFCVSVGLDFLNLGQFFCIQPFHPKTWVELRGFPGFTLQNELPSKV